MTVTVKELEVKEDKTVKEFIDELQLSTAPVLLEIAGEVFYPEEIPERRLKRGDQVSLIPVIAGG